MVGSRRSPELCLQPFTDTRVNPVTAACDDGEGPGRVPVPKEKREESGQQIPPVPQEKLLEAWPHFSAEAVTVGEAAAAACNLLEC